MSQFPFIDQKLFEECERKAIEIRNRLHAYPEVGYELDKTREFLTQELIGFGLDVVEIGGGLVARIKGKDAFPVGTDPKIILHRAEMDALPDLLEDASDGREIVSQNPGKHHGCGHDLHPAIAMAQMMYFARRPQDLPEDVDLAIALQADEEGGTGAKAMFDAGLKKLLPNAEPVAFHNAPWLDAGEVQVSPGPVLGGVIDTRTTFTNEKDLTVSEQGLLFNLMAEFNEKSRQIVSELNAGKDNPERHQNVFRNAGLEFRGDDDLLYTNKMQTRQVIEVTGGDESDPDRLLNLVSQGVLSGYQKEGFDISVEKTDKGVRVFIDGQDGHAGMIAHDVDNVFNVALDVREKIGEFVSSQALNANVQIAINPVGREYGDSVDWSNLAMAGTLRTMTSPLEQMADRRIKDLGEELVREYNEKAGKDLFAFNMHHSVAVPPTVNGANEAEAMRGAAILAVGEGKISDIVSLTAAEDFGGFTGPDGYGTAEEPVGVMMFIGQCDASHPAQLHENGYNSNLGIIADTLRIFITNTLRGGNFKTGASCY